MVKHILPRRRCLPGAFAALLVLAGCQTGKVPSVTTGAPPEASKKTIRTPDFNSETAPAAPTLAEGGFIREPTFVDTFDPGWNHTQTEWQIATWVQNGTRMSPSRCRANGDGHLVQNVLPGEPYRGGSLQSRREFGYGRWLARVRPPSVPGSLHSIFTKDWDDLTTDTPHDGGKAEVDIEFLTHTFGQGKGEVHLAIHLLNHSPLWHADVKIDFDPSQSFNVWGFDILPDRVVWHVNGKVIYTWMYSKEYYVNTGYEMLFNSWTREVWVKGPPEEQADYHIDWVRFHPLADG